tara:strand:+ start:136 stop:405 length:270 start_codon:yes stop_codon:yes gene_type:complete
LAACAGSSIEKAPPPDVEIQTVKVPVSVGCVGDRGEAVVPLADRYSDADWRAKPVGAKAQAVRAQAGRRLNERDRERAATAACPPVKAN